MNRQAMSISIASSFAITASLKTHKGEHNPNIFSNLLNYSGLIYVALADSTGSVDDFVHSWTLHYARGLNFPKILFEQLEYCKLVPVHTIDALTKERKLKDLIEELAFLLAVDGKLQTQHVTAAEWGISLVSVGTLVAAGTDLLEPETREPESVASMLVYISNYALTRKHPDLKRLYERAYDPPMLQVGRLISRALYSQKFALAVENVKLALTPARELLVPLRVLN